MRAKAENSGLVELVVQVDETALDGAAEMKVVFALFPTDVVGPGVIIACEEGGGVVTEGETALHADALNGIGSRLERERNAKDCGIHDIRPRTTVGDFARIAETEIIDQAGRENMRLVGQEVLRRDCKSSVRVGYEQQRIKNGRLGEAVEFVATAELVILAKRVIDAAYGGVEVFNVGLGKWHRRLRTGRN